MSKNTIVPLNNPPLHGDTGTLKFNSNKLSGTNVMTTDNVEEVLLRQIKNTERKKQQRVLYEAFFAVNYTEN